MQVSFLRMCQNMKEYRNYLPASILAMMRGDTSIADDDGEDDEEGDVSVNNPLAHSKGDSIVLSASKMSSSRTSSDSPLIPNKVDLATIFKRHITVLVVNVRHTHTLHFPNIARSNVPVNGSSVKTLEHYIHSVLGVVTARNGTADVFLGDRFLATWNTVKRRATHRTN
eukprot:PhM_4_TR9518/c3_g1_i1/m.98166